MRGANGGSGHVLSDTTSRWSDLSRRIKTALVLVPIALFCVWLGGIAFLMLMAAAIVVLAIEWAGMCGRGESYGSMAWMIVILVGASIFGAIGWPAIGLVFVLAGTVIAAVWRGADMNAAGGGSDMAMAYPYLGLAAVALPWLRAGQDAGLANTLFLLSVVWGSDIGAYIIGRLIGGPKLAPAISPGKTWSGAVGGLAGAALAGSVVAYCFSSGFSPSHMMGLAVGLGIVSQAGDLLESALKRRFGVKDSGSIMPGHGGLLDRLDALLVAGPAAAVLASFVGRGVVLWR